MNLVLARFEAIDRLTAMLDAGRVSRTELQAIVEELRAAVDRPSGDGGARRADSEPAAPRSHGSEPHEQ